MLHIINVTEQLDTDSESPITIRRARWNYKLNLGYLNWVATPKNTGYDQIFFDKNDLFSQLNSRCNFNIFPTLNEIEQTFDFIKPNI